MENNIVCNGRSNPAVMSNAVPSNKDARSSNGNSSSNSSSNNTNHTKTTIDLAMIPNLNWLIHMAFARQDYKYCNEAIEYQFSETYDHEYLYYVKGLIARIEGNLQESLLYLQKAIEFNPNNLDNLKEIAKTLYAMERYKQALEIFVKIDKTSPNGDHEVCYYIGDLLYRKCNRMQVAVSDEVKEYFTRAVRDGKQLESYTLLAEIYKAENNLPKAIEMLENITQITTENIDILTEIGILYLRINDTKGAFDKLYEVTKLHENCSKALLAIGSILQSKNDVDGALNKYKLIDAESQKGAEIWNNVGLCFYKKKKFIAAISCLKKAVWLEPTNFNCLFNLGLIYLTAHQFASAFHTLAAAACIRLDNAECYMLLGICLRNLNDHGNAYLAFERSVMLPDAVKNPLIYLNSAVYNMQMKRYELAVANINNFFSVVEHVNVRNEFKAIAEKMREYLPQPSTSNSQTVEVEHSTEPISSNSTNDIEGAGEAMATLDERENLV
ncbi:Bardet-Biedl syndrome 4 protein homolog [Sitodiplosis mosellana]|uniref:Bardet-Biedl syndrome 4 protein homolog n=1 Tax=Sitodiplosis mosellana TaxID=263140 RepID=UPI002443C969|nr:Bardet-Biedl syndrome 4 protein homolog [Sitodiplosis mosellana]